MIRTAKSLWALEFGFFVATALAQTHTIPTSNILNRMTMVESRYGRGSVFSLDVDGREYWITAKHILTGARHPPYGFLAEKDVSLKILDPRAEEEHWITVRFSVIDAGKDVDIVALAPSRALLHNPPLSPAHDPAAAILLGGECEFLGFPYGGAWRSRTAEGQSYWMPFVKHCTVSAFTVGTPPVMILDGINNEGFSGGPVLYGTEPGQVIAVISGYLPEASDVISSLIGSPRPKLSSKRKFVNLNSGFILAYEIKPVIDAIRLNPAGPLRQ